MLLYGTALYNGDGVAPDPVTAYAYVSRAAAQGLDVGAGDACRPRRDDAARCSARRALRWPRRWSRPSRPPRREVPKPAAPPRSAARPPASAKPAGRSRSANRSPAAAGGSSSARSASARPPKPCSRKLRGKVGARQALLRPRGQGRPAPGRPLRQPRRGRRGLRRAWRPGLLPGRRRARRSTHSRARDPLRPQQGVEPVMVEPRVGDRGQRGLGAIGDAQPRGLDHRACHWRRRRPRSPRPRASPSSSRASTSARALDAASTIRPVTVPPAAVVRLEHIGLDPLEPEHVARPARRKR